MAYIYKITNTINNKIYIGATTRSVEKRWYEHIRDSKKEITKNRPFHMAIREFGISNFKVEIIEEVDSLLMDKREEFWINELNTFDDGYNATFGGAGKNSIDYNMVISEYNKVKSVKSVSENLNIDMGYASKILKNHKIEVISSKEQNKDRSKSVLMISESGESMIFESIREAGDYILKIGLATGTLSSVRLHISQCANGDRKTAYKHKWKFN